MTRIGGLVPLMLVLLLFGLPTGSHAEGKEAEDTGDAVTYFDFTDDQSSYAAQVAALNRGELPDRDRRVQAQSEDGKRGQSAEDPLVAVLCRTDGNAFDFRPWAPAYIIAGPFDCYTLYFDSETTADKAVSGLAATPGIRYAERDADVGACGISTMSFRSWGAERMAFGPYLDWASGVPQGSATVAIVDSGVYPHSFYSGRMLESGYDYVDGDDDATSDENGHGTNVAGIVADCTQGLPVNLYPIRVLNASGGGKVSNTVNGIREAITRGVDVINMSLTTKDGISASLDEAVLDALEAGITVVVAAGNSAVDSSGISPSHLTEEGVLIVGAADSDGKMTSYTNYGSSVDVFVYGSKISCCSNNGGFVTASGTSMAAPHMAGLAAVLLLTHDGISPSEIEGRIRNATEQSAQLRIPELSRITPDNPGFSLLVLRMGLGDRYQFCTVMRPATSAEPVRYSSSDETVVSVQQGILSAAGLGTATVTAQSRGMADYRFEVIVEEDCETMILPRSLKVLGEEAFSGNTELRGHIILPEGVETLAEGAFDGCHGIRTVQLPKTLSELSGNTFSDAVLLCPEGSVAEQFAKDLQLSYILLTE